MKKCPYCAEEIQDAAIVCRYCGRDLPVESGPSAHVAMEKRRLAEPSAGLSLVLGVLLLGAIYGIALLVLRVSVDSAASWESGAAWFQLGMMFLITLLAVPGLNPEKRGFLRYIGIFFLAVIPIAGWLVIYWAGKGIARSASRKTWLGILVAFDAIVAVIGWSLISSLSQPYTTAVPTQITYPTIAPAPTAVLTYTDADVQRVLQGMGIQAVPANCAPTNEIYSGYSGCVYGIVDTAGVVYDMTGFAALQVSLKGQTSENGHPLVINDTNMAPSDERVQPGKCVMTSGTVNMNRQGTHLFVSGKISPCAP